MKKINWLNKIKKLKGTPNSVAIGVACGVAVSFTPFVGAHLVLAMLTAWFLRGNVVAAVLGTAFGNPWTFPFIWASILYTGRKMLQGEGAQILNVNFETLFARAFRALIKLDFDLFFSDIWPILWPMMVGSLPYCLSAWWLTYIMVKKMLNKRKIAVEEK